MDADTPVNIPVRFSEWVGGDHFRNVRTVVFNARPVLDALEYDRLPVTDADAVPIAQMASDAGLLEGWSGPFAVLLGECAEYEDYREWRRTHGTVEEGRGTYQRMCLMEFTRQVEGLGEDLRRMKAEVEGLSRRMDRVLCACAPSRPAKA